VAHIDLTDETFQKEVLEAKEPVVVDFWAPWCGPCLMLAPIFDELEKEHEGKIKFTKINVDENKEHASLYGVQGIPTVMIFVDGNLKERLVGVQPKDVYKQTLEKYLSSKED